MNIKLEKYYLINKLEGETPLFALGKLRLEKRIDKEIPMTYAGRLDPIAEGLLMILVSEECKNKEEYLGLDKEYEVEVLLGLRSDTGDILGIVETGLENQNDRKYNENEIREKLKTLIGKRFETYPKFSSKTVKGKPLFQITRDGEINETELPKKEIEIYSIDFLGMKTLPIIQIIDQAIERIDQVKGDFRQEEIIQTWKYLWEVVGDFTILKMKVRCSTGTYMRTLAEKIGELLGTSGLAWKIKRTKIGNYSLLIFDDIELKT